MRNLEKNKIAFVGGPRRCAHTAPSSSFGAHTNSIFLRVYFLTQESHGFLDQNIIGPEQPAPNDTPLCLLDCRPQSHVSPTFFERLDSPFNGYPNRTMNQGDTTTQLSGFPVTQQLILGELDTEIRVRERLQEAVESRIAWATCLQSSLGAVTEKHGTSVRQRRGENMTFTSVVFQVPGPGLTLPAPTPSNWLLQMPSTSQKCHCFPSCPVKLASSIVPLILLLRRHRLPPRTSILDPTPATPASGGRHRPSKPHLNSSTFVMPPPILSRGSHAPTAPVVISRAFKVS
jgi:hypothetical protein